jgi:hypothetical protein
MYGRACSRYLGQRLVVAIGLCHKTLIPVAARVSVPRTLLPVQTRRFRDCGFHRFSTKVIEKQENGNDADLRHASTTEGDSTPRSETSIRTGALSTLPMSLILIRYQFSLMETFR